MKAELNDMEKRGVIRKVEEPTNWVNSIAIVEKPDGSLRLFFYPRHLNKAIKREHFQIPTIEDITTRTANAKWFTKLDANRGYWQIPLDEESQLLTTSMRHSEGFVINLPHLALNMLNKCFRNQ